MEVLIDYENEARSLQYNISQFQDISIILTKLENQGSIRKMTQIFTQVFEVEHQFTIQELKKIEVESNAQDSNFFNEQYKMNAQIFRKNFSLIAQNLIDSIADTYLKIFKQRFVKPKVKKPANIDIHVDNKNVEYTPHIDNRETEESRELTPTTTATNFNNAPKFQDRDDFNANLERNESASNIRDSVDNQYYEQEQQGQNSQRNRQQQQYEQQQYEQQQYEQQQYDQKQQYAQEQYAKELADISEDINDGRTYTMGMIPPSTDMHINRHTLAHVPTLGKHEDRRLMSSSPYEGHKDQRTLSKSRSGSATHKSHNHDDNSKDYSRNSSKSRTGANTGNSGQKSPDYLRQAFPRSQSQDKGTPAQKASYKQIFAQSTSKMSSPRLTTGGSNGSKFLKSMSNSGLYPNPALLDSEFSYSATGGLMPKSRRKLHDDPLEVPGPGYYDTSSLDENGRRKSPSASFGKSPRITFLDRAKKDTPGPQYYPIKHFTSKNY